MAGPAGKGFEDVFGKFVSVNASNQADIASQYPYNPARWRFFSGSATEPNRIFLNYNTDSRYSHQRFDGTGERDVHKVSPNAGETLILQTPEQLRYIVGFEAYITQAMSINQSLQTGDQIRIGPFDGTDGYGTEFRGNLGDDRCEMFIMRNGSKLETKVVNIKDITSSFTRFGHRFVWYNVGRVRLEQSYSDSGTQIEGNPKGLSTDSGRGPRQGNLPIRFEVTASGSTTGLTANFGSAAWQKFGDLQGRLRAKFAHISTSIGTANTWVPFAAIRLRDSYDLISSRLQDISIGTWTGNGDIRISAIFVSPEKTDASGFVVPVEHSDKNSAIEHTTTVSTFPDSTGSVVSSASNPGGYQGGYSTLYSSGQSTNSQQISTTTDDEIKQDLHKNTNVILLANADNTGDIQVDYLTLQDW